MHDRLLSLLKLPSIPGLVDFVEKSYLKYPHEEEAASQTAEALATQINYKKLSPIDLIELSQACEKRSIPYSARIIFCASKAQILDLKPNDTIVTPDGVWQINADFQEHAILTQKELAKALPNNFLPTKDTDLNILESNDEIPAPTDNETNAKAKQLTLALNTAFAKKTNALYLGQEDSEILQKNIEVMRLLNRDYLIPEIQYRKIQDVILKINGFKTSAQLIDLSKKLSDEKPTDIIAADEYINYLINTIPKKIQFHKLSEADLKTLTYIAYIYRFSGSQRIITAGSIASINDSDFDLQAQDTIILPDKVVQIDKDGRPNIVLSQKEMQQHLPSKFIPDLASPVQEITDKDAIIQLNQSLNQIFQNKPDALYMTHADTKEKEEKTFMDMLGAITQLAEEEIIRREIPQNLILQVLSLKTDADFLHYYWQRMHIPFDKKNPKKFEENIKKNVQVRAVLDNLTDDQLRTLIQQCRIWAPKTSHRILCSQVLPAQYEIGDTIILPNGVYQMRLNSHGQVKQELIIDPKTMQNLNLHEHIPDNKTEVTIYNDFNKADAKELIGFMNSHIALHPKGMYLCEIPRASEGYGTVNIVLQKMAEQTLQDRFLQQYRKANESKSFFNFNFSFGLFGSSAKKVAPAPVAITQDLPIPPLKPKKTKIKELRSQAKDLKKLQKTLKEPKLEERVLPNSNTMLLHSNPSMEEETPPSSPTSTLTEIIDELDLKLGEEHTASIDPLDHSIKIQQQKTIVMEYSPDTVAIYKPLLKKNPMKDLEKAELFLKALGIPPTKGKHAVEVKGGHRSLRKAIRELFKEFKQKEHLQKKTHLKPKNSDSDTDTDLSTDSGRRHHFK
ncbi:MAG: hypothetical protein ACO1N3_03305 [Gammaproteobacteria bacterium]